jgi:hypothetical protein
MTVNRLGVKTPGHSACSVCRLSRHESSVPSVESTPEQSHRGLAFGLSPPSRKQLWVDGVGHDKRRGDYSNSVGHCSFSQIVPGPASSKVETVAFVRVEKGERLR